MNDSNEQLIEFMKSQIVNENRIVSSVNAVIKDINNLPVKLILKGISLDSAKHAEFYASAISLLTTVPQAMNQDNLDEQYELVEKHREFESELIDKLGKMLPAIQNKKVALILNIILNDEKRHHEMLNQILDIIVRGETLTEEDWWKMLWEDVPFHGAPG